MRVGRWLCGIGLLAAGTFGAWLYWRASANERELRAKARVVRAGELREYWGIKLGADKNEVLYLKGEPTERKEKGDDQDWVYGGCSATRSSRLSHTGSSASGQLASMVAGGAPPGCAARAPGRLAPRPEGLTTSEPRVVTARPPSER